MSGQSVSINHIGFLTPRQLSRQRSAFRFRKDTVAACGRGRVALGRVIVPLDSADPGTRRLTWTMGGRDERTLTPQGERRTLFARDVVETADEILERLFADPILPHVGELRLELPYEFEDEEYRQIIHDFITLVAPELGWPHGGVKKSKRRERRRR